LSWTIFRLARTGQDKSAQEKIGKAVYIIVKKNKKNKKINKLNY